jgi:iron complex outermembrane receptor protein
MQDYDETSVNDIPPLPQMSNVAKLEDTGIGAYALATLTTREAWDLSLGLRMDHEKKDADLLTFSMPPLNTDRDFTEVSPQFSIVRPIAKGKIIYGNIGRGYRAGGFNPVSPEESEAYDEETSWNYEIGAKTTWFDERLKVNMAIFHILWNHLQVNLPFASTYYIANVGDAESTGMEFEVYARPSRNWDIFGTVGYDRARYGNGTTSIRTDAYNMSSEIDISDNDLIYTPEFTANLGTQYSWDIGLDAKIYMRAEVNGYGRYYYNTANTESQSSYWLANFRAGYRSPSWFAELWVKNAFDEEYIPIAFEFPNYQSGFLGENGAPRMVGLRTGINF